MTRFWDNHDWFRYLCYVLMTLAVFGILCLVAIGWSETEDDKCKQLYTLAQQGNQLAQLELVQKYCPQADNL